MTAAPIRAAVALLLLIIAIYWKLILFPSGYVWFDHYDMCQLEVPSLQFLATSIHGGHFPLWDPHVWAGLPVLGVGQPGPVYPLNLLFLALPLKVNAIPIATLNWWFVAVHFIAGYSLYLFCRDVNLSRAASLVGGIAFACGGFFGSLPWLDRSNAASLTPAIFLFAVRLWRGRDTVRNAALLGLLLGVSWLSGHHEIPLLQSYAVLLGGASVFAYRAIMDRARVRLWFRELGCTALALALAAAVSALQTLPLYEFGHTAKRWIGTPDPIGWRDTVPYAVHRQYSLPWNGIFGLLFPTPTPEAHMTLFAGATVVILAICGLVFAWRRAEARYAAWLGLAGLIYALGGNTPLHRIAYLLLPMIDKARTPVRGLFLTAFALAVLAAFGADAFLERRLSRRIMVPTIAAVAALVLFLNGSRWLPLMYPAVQTHFLLKAVIALIALTALSLWHASARVASVVLLALVLLEAGTVATYRITALTPARAVCATALFGHEAEVQRLRAAAGSGRITVNRDELMTAPGDLYGLDQMQSFVAGVPANLLRLDLDTPRVRQLFGVTAHAGKTAGEISIEPVSNEFPRAWVVHAAVRASSDSELRDMMQRPDVDLGSTALLLATVPAFEGCSDQELVSVARPDSDTVVLNTTLRCRGLVILSDVFYPGWRASMDGKPVPIQEVDGALRGVLAEAGRHTIVMHYRPTSVYIGAMLTLAGLLSSVLLCRVKTDRGQDKAQVARVAGCSEYPAN